MSDTALQVLIIGGGPGGLCLAQGLHKAGVDVAVYERDAGPQIRRQGYRIHLDARAARALHTCLPTNLYELFVATLGQPARQVTVINERLKQLHVTSFPGQVTPSTDPATISAPVDRLTLREILLAGLDDHVHFGKAFTHYELLANGRVQAFFADGTMAEGDVLVAADGVHSRVRRQFLPHAGLNNLNRWCIYGKTLMTDELCPLLPAFFHDGFVALVDAKKQGTALGLVEFRNPPAQIAEKFQPGLHLHATSDYLSWALTGTQEQFGIAEQDWLSTDSATLQDIVRQRVRNWHPDLARLILAADPEETFPIIVNIAVPIEPWTTAPVTLLGDAIHAVSPSAGSGANLALMDAGLLCQQLLVASRGESGLLPAIHCYEEQMVKYGFDAVRASGHGEKRYIGGKEWLKLILHQLFSRFQPAK